MPEKIKIKVSPLKCGCCYGAKFDGPPEDDKTWNDGEGKNRDEAIGHLIRSNPDFFGVEFSFTR